LDKLVFALKRFATLWSRKGGEEWFSLGENHPASIYTNCEAAVVVAMEVPAWI
jgi:hypothetical protein